MPRAWTALGPAQLASAHPGSAIDRLQARALYERCLLHYRQQVRPEDLPGGVDDLGAALARFVAANFEALNGAQATRGMLARLERQLVAIVRRSPAWPATGIPERQAFFEQLALLSVLVTESAAQAIRQGVAALDNVQRAASGYLRQLVGLDPEGLMLGPDGLALRDEPPPYAAAATVDTPLHTLQPA